MADKCGLDGAVGLADMLLGEHILKEPQEQRDKDIDYKRKTVAERPKEKNNKNEYEQYVTNSENS